MELVSAVHQLIGVGHFLHGLADGRAVCKHTARPALDNVWNFRDLALVATTSIDCFLVATNRIFFPDFAICLKARRSASNLRQFIVPRHPPYSLYIK